MLLNRSVPTLGGANSNSALQPELKRFDLRNQQWGEYFSGFDWQLFGCLTYARKQSDRSACGALTRFLRDASESVEGGLSYIAVAEWRTSGCGLPSIPLHWHLLMGCSEGKAYGLSLFCRDRWKQHGASDIRAYCYSVPGAFYVAKTAKHVDFEVRMHNLHRMKYHGSQDLHTQMAANPYVPEHAHWRADGETLAVRERGVTP
jgi:hypothetical protein